MLDNVARNIFLGNKSILLKRYNLTLAMFNNIKSKQFMISSKDSKNWRTTTETDETDIETSQPIKYSSSKAANMRINEYRDPHGDKLPWYQPHAVMLSITVFMIYFCILREENDIDLMLYSDLGDTLNQFDNTLADRKAAHLESKKET